MAHKKNIFLLCQLLKTVGFFLIASREENRLMIKKSRAGAWPLLASALVWVLFLGCFSNGSCGSPQRIVVLPFQIPGDKSATDLKAFADHSYKSVRAAVSSLKGDLTLESEQTTEKLLSGKDGAVTEEDARRVALENGADLVIYGFISGAPDSGYQFKAVMWDLRNNRATVSTDLKVPNIHGLPGVLQLFINSVGRRLHGSTSLPLYRTDSRPSPNTPQSGRLSALVDLPRSATPWRSPEIAGTLSGLDVGDIDGDKKNETVLVGDQGIYISRFEDGGLRSLTQFSQSPVVYLSVEAEDLDRDGVAELVVCHLTPQGLGSSIIRYVNRNFQVVAEFPNVILRTVIEPSLGSDPVLVGQEMDAEDCFSGRMILYEVSGNNITPKGKLMLPQGTLLLSYTSGYMGKAKEFLRIILTQDQRLSVFDEKNEIKFRISDRIFGLERYLSVRTKGSSTKAFNLPGKIAITDTNLDGESELLVIKARDSKSEIQAFGWDGFELIKRWNTVETDGMISDFKIKDLKNEGVRSLVLLLVQASPILGFVGPHSIIFAYDLVP
jgi:hypothetical protein